MMKGKLRSRIIDRKKKIHCKNTMCTMLYILHKMYTRLNVLFYCIYIIIYRYIRVANYRQKFFIAIIDKIFKIITILSVIGDSFGKARNNIAEVIFVLLCVYVSRYTLIFCNVPCIVLRLHFL